MESIGHFEDGDAPAAAVAKYGEGRVIAIGFLPMLAYAQAANFKPTTLEEVWPEQPRRLIQLALDAAKVSPVAKCDVPVVETSLLDGENGAALVLVNYTYKSIHHLTVDVKLAHPIKSATSVDGKVIAMEKTADGVRLRLPLEWTDIILLRR
jgi:hypothetical protein